MSWAWEALAAAVSRPGFPVLAAACQVVNQSTRQVSDRRNVSESDVPSSPRASSVPNGQT